MLKRSEIEEMKAAEEEKNKKKGKKSSSRSSSPNKRPTTESKKTKTPDKRDRVDSGRFHIGNVSLIFAYLPFNLRQGNDSQIPKVNTTNFGVQTVFFLGNRLWRSLPNVVKETNSLSVFKAPIKCRKMEDCSCRFCKTYMPQVGYLR